MRTLKVDVGVDVAVGIAVDITVNNYVHRRPSHESKLILAVLLIFRVAQIPHIHHRPAELVVVHHTARTL